VQNSTLKHLQKKMVYINDTALNDLNDILDGLMMWKKHSLEPAHAENYVDDIVEFCYTLDKLQYHFSAQYEEHLKYGKFVCLYKRNYSTVWYIIYDKDLTGNIFINKIINNYMTTV
jgi:hypothetical protein